MTEKLALKILHDFQNWRRGKNIPQPDPTKVGLAIDVAIRGLRLIRELRTLSTEEFSEGYTCKMCELYIAERGRSRIQMRGMSVERALRLLNEFIENE